MLESSCLEDTVSNIFNNSHQQYFVNIIMSQENILAH